MVAVTLLPASSSASGLFSIIKKPPRRTQSLRLNFAGIMHSVLLPFGYSTCSAQGNVAGGVVWGGVV